MYLIYSILFYFNFNNWFVEIPKSKKKWSIINASSYYLRMNKQNQIF